MQSLSEADRKAILALARQALAEAVCQDRLLRPYPAEGSIFRTAMWRVCDTSRARETAWMHRGDRRRASRWVRASCNARRPRRCRIRRFAPMLPEELAEAEIEVSLLSPLQRIHPEEIEIGKHGLVVEQGLRRGLLLPQVAVEHRLDRERFLEETCHKAGFARDAWKNPETQDLRVYLRNCERRKSKGSQRNRKPAPEMTARAVRKRVLASRAIRLRRNRRHRCRWWCR